MKRNYGASLLLLSFLSALLLDLASPTALAQAAVLPLKNMITFAQHQAAAASGGPALMQVAVPRDGLLCTMSAKDPEQVRLSKQEFPCPRSAWRQVYLPANQTRRTRHWELFLTLRDPHSAASTKVSGWISTQSPAWRGSPRLARVAVIGDSITRLSTQAIGNNLWTHFASRINGRDGYQINQQEPVLKSVMRGRYGPPDAVVVNLGTNNIIYALFPALSQLEPQIPPLIAPNPRWELQYAQMAREIQPAACVILVNMTESNPDSNFNRIARRMNNYLATFVSRHKNFHLLDWAAALKRDPSLLSGGNLIAAVHPNKHGQQVYADLISSALHQSCHLSGSPGKLKPQAH
jgi:hypothetical protein